MTFFPLDRDLLSSSTWAQGTPEQLKVWLYLLLAANPRNGVVEDSDPGIALRCGLPLPVVVTALEWLAAPDPHSRTKEHEGRRIARLPSGAIQVLNYLRHRDRDHSTPRWRRWKDRQAQGQAPTAPTVTNDVGNDVQVQVQVQTETETERGPAAAAASPAPAGRAAVIEDVFDYWRERTGHKAAKLSPKRRRAIVGRLRDKFRPEDLKRAIDGCLASPFHQGVNDRQQRYDDLELILRDVEHVERFLRAADEQAQAPAGLRVACDLCDSTGLQLVHSTSRNGEPIEVRRPCECRQRQGSPTGRPRTAAEQTIAAVQQVADEEAARKRREVA